MSWKIAGCSILLFVLQHIVRVIYSFGYHLHYYQHYPGPCQQVEGIDLGSASLYTLPDGLTLITSGFSMNLLSPSYQAFYEEKGARGGVYMMDLKNASGELAPVPLSVVAEHSGFNPQSFRPHGISVWHDHDSGRYIVFVVNHPVREVDRVEKFVLDRGNGTLLHVKTYTSPKLRSLYDVQAVGEDSFYVSNVLYEQRSRFFMLLELFSLMPWSSVVLYQPETGYSQVVSGLTSATGLLVSPCGLFVYVLSCMGAEIRVYRRQEDNSLLLQQSYPLFTHPDMAAMDPSTGDLFVGAH
ncbi:serum paraoxonase/arylesterase 2, partial [Aplysia californica]|uniref:Paraoxonase n=1 Tax=Aplysia californica TaxID=6500 RepID=A0ABM1A4K5_APLCA